MIGRTVVRWLLAALTLMAGLAPGLAMPGGADALAFQVEPRVIASATCVGPTAEREPFVWVNVYNTTGMPIRLIAVDGLSTSQTFNPFFLESPLDELLGIEIPDGEGVSVDARWSGLIGGDGEGLAAGAVVVTSVGVLTPICSTQPQDLGELILDDPIPDTAQDRLLQEARSMAETLGQLESWRAYPLLYALLLPDAQAAVDFDQLACWYVGRYGGRYDPERLEIFSTRVSVAEIESWTWEVNGTAYERAVTYGYEQEVGTRTERETVSGTAHLEWEDGVWRWFFGTSQEELDQLPDTCDLDGV